MKYRAKSTTCSTKGCNGQRRKNGRLCNGCHATKMRDWRKEHVYVKRTETRSAEGA
jgi:hypothetical protein